MKAVKVHSTKNTRAGEKDPHGEQGGAARPVSLALLLGGMAFLSMLIVEADYRGWVSVLGWRKTPGFVVLCGLAALIFILLGLRRPVGKIAAVGALFGMSLFLDQLVAAVNSVAHIFPVSMPIWLLVALSPPLLGGYVVHLMRVPVVLRAAFALLGGYIQAVHIYNQFHLTQHMGFFDGGWVS